jgi:phospholipid/cholesterol/gamma-HCH transport system ATP-binding protein
VSLLHPNRAPVEMDHQGPPIEVRGLVSKFGDMVIHDGVDLTVRKGEVIGVVGGSGTGKTVLLNTIIGLREPDAGEIRVFGNNPHGSNRERAEIDKGWGVLFQQGALFSALTVKENVAAPLLEHTGLPHGLIGELAELKIALAGLPAEAAGKYPSELSGGMRKRASLARAPGARSRAAVPGRAHRRLDPIGGQAFDD